MKKKFYLFGSITKSDVYNEHPNIMRDMKEHFIRICVAIVVGTTDQILQSVIVHSRKCIDAERHHFEHLK